MNLPNILTTMRIFLVPIYLAVYFSNIKNKMSIALAIFILAGITDFLDGFIARKYNLVSKLGKVLDPLADKLMMFAVLITLTSSEYIPSWIVVILGMKELIMIIGGGILYLFKGNQVLPSNNYGKIATLCFYVATIVTVFRPASSISKYLFILTVVLNLIAFVNYLFIYMSMTGKKLNHVDK